MLLTRNSNKGFSLIELMIAVGVLGIIAAVAIPMYSDYIATARISVMQDNIKTIRLMQDERRRRRGEYAEGTYDPSGTQTLTANLGWSPGSTADVITYVVTCTTDGATAGECARTSGYTVVATHDTATANPITVTVPAP